MTNFINKISDSLTRWVGSTASLLIHTLFFLGAFLSHWIIGWTFDFILLVLTTVVSLEAIYLAIFIQRSVNQQAVRLNDVEEAVDDVEEALDDVEEALDDVEEGLEDVEKSINDQDEEEGKKKRPTKAQTLADIEVTIKDLQILMKNLKEKK